MARRWRARRVVKWGAATATLLLLALLTLGFFYQVRWEQDRRQCLSFGFGSGALWFGGFFSAPMMYVGERLPPGWHIYRESGPTSEGFKTACRLPVVFIDRDSMPRSFFIFLPLWIVL